MTYRITFFENQYDTDTERFCDVDSFDTLEGVMQNQFKKPFRTKQDAFLISPAIYRPETTRANANVVEWSKWIAVDVDEEKPETLEKTFEELKAYRGFAVSTASSSKKQPKFRLFLDLTSKVSAENIPHFWFALAKKLPVKLDEQTKDLSRMFYLPGNYACAELQFFVKFDGKPINPDVLMAETPFINPTSTTFIDRLPKEFQELVIAHRKDASNNTNVTWTTYQDCPFWPKASARDYQSMNSTGWYHKMYSIMVGIATKAIHARYPITADQIEQLCRQFDAENGNWYAKRPMKTEADRAIEYCYKTVVPKNTFNFTT